MNISGVDLLAAPESDEVDSETERQVNDDTTFINYAHFNTSYPFLGVDSNVGAILEADFQAKRPDVSCDYNSYYNVWNVCYYEGTCNYDTFKTNIQMNFGTNATFTL